MNFTVLAPELSHRTRSNLGLLGEVKCLGQLPDGRRVAIDAARRFSEASTAIYPGYLIPVGAEAEPMIPEGVIVKFSPYRYRDDNLRREIGILTALQKVPGIPRVIHQGEQEALSERGFLFGVLTEHRNAPYFVMNCLSGERLSAFALAPWGAAPPRRESVAYLAGTIFPALAERLAAVHEEKVVHKDIKPNNGLFDPQAKLVNLLDFERANWLNARLREESGAMLFSPPEIQISPPETEDVRFDTYSFGVTCFILLTGEQILLYSNVTNPAKKPDEPFAREAAFGEYHQDLYEMRHWTPERLVQESNLPPALKETPLGKYLIQLAHPDLEQRPLNMLEIAQNLRRLSGELGGAGE